MSAPKQKSSSKDRAPKSRKEAGKSRIAPSTTSSSRSSRQVPFSHSRTTSANSAVSAVSRGRTKPITVEEQQSRPITAPEGPAPTFGAQHPTGAIPPLPNVVNVPSPLIRAETTPAPLRPNDVQPPLTRQVTFDNILQSPDDSTGNTVHSAELAAFGGQSRSFQRPPSVREPAYKSKRPPPIASNLTLPNNPQQSKSPSPSSSRSLGRTLTQKLFGRRPSNGRRSMVRAALSDEPEPIPVPPMPSSVPSSAVEPPTRPSRSPEPLSAPPFAPPPRPSRSPEPALIPSVSSSGPLSPPEIISEEAEQARKASLAALGGEDTKDSAARSSDPDVEEPKTQSEAKGPQQQFDFNLGSPGETDGPAPPVLASAAPTSKKPTEPARNQQGEENAGIKRASLDSVSSYGSIGFTERTFSSRSSPPPPEESRKVSDAGPKVDMEESMLEMPAPLRPRIAEAAADSPTDPLYSDGLLSPILNNDKDRTSADSSIDAQVVPPTNNDKTLSSDHEDSAVPAPLFRPRKSSLASSNAPLFQRPAALEEPVPSPRFDLSNPADIAPPALRPRKDSMASVGGRRAGSKGTCRGCSQPILAMQKSVSSADGRLSGKYHKECFVCRTCKEPFATAEFYVHDDHPYCGHHYHKMCDSLCATCGKGIEGLYMETANVAGRGKEKHHPACLKCATCRVQLTNDYFELSGKVYCERDAFRLASHPRVHSRGPARPSPLVREYIRSGDPGAIKGSNFPERRTNRPRLDVR
ncbi:uncharacterized protein HMPREF1541_06332 [Cyphellophora europaea CBS 101466]|uniref:LIM zinc-binding domain-containing protein n=1 Tax=Cyphellophora europaea (strain CBS 101466) TaxID=1220924 RepID=W2RP45_CYPE1|nr:uncharacterized protein HMPREF1541_06332 [Cyphellophora europaea CBS 101466]ETN38301.1 hypothetical protein HMPREF1541_06332 [Cyphellophora europaea CBS 101466]